MSRGHGRDAHPIPEAIRLISDSLELARFCAMAQQRSSRSFQATRDFIARAVTSNQSFMVLAASTVSISGIA